ncbi:MAG TPA: ABC transporter permease, partial [Citricoccus sp.]
MTTTAPAPAPVRGPAPGEPASGAGPNPTPGPARRRVPLTVWAAGGFAVLLVLAATVPQLLATADPRAIDLAAPLAPPSTEHWFGTDQSGRDLYSRIVHGTGPALLIGLGAA